MGNIHINKPHRSILSVEEYCSELKQLQDKGFLIDEYDCNMSLEQLKVIYDRATNLFFRRVFPNTGPLSLKEKDLRSLK